MTVSVFCRGRDFATFSPRKSKCRIQNRLGTPFVAYKFACGRIVNKNAVISPDKQNNDRKVSDCLSLTRSNFVLLTPLKQCIILKWPLNILNHISHSHLLMSSRIKHYWSFSFFVNGDRQIVPHKNARGLKDWDYCYNRFSNFNFFLYNNNNGYFINLH